MWYILGAVLVVGLSMVFGLGRTGAGLQKTGSGAGPILGVSFQSLSLAEIDMLLDRLESMEPPERVMGAMCYAPMAYPEVAEYVCPVCGEKTLYSGYLCAMIEWELPGMRRMAGSIDSLTDFVVVLDERQFCHFCSDTEAENPVALLRVSTSDSTEVVNSVSSMDLRILEGFLTGNLYYLTSNDSQEPLKGHAERIRQLLGLAPDPQ
ncbi:MAG: hypothetical protein JXA64_09320 [Candidatus Fermentibacteraceae bacterium]|nr:hypothetical protein [Candidatus Fermentibacteraceae bacterium]MBN2609298.1 hypothetical protein [Candidatus Fermentibacteraceae bacterium]